MPSCYVSSCHVLSSCALCCCCCCSNSQHKSQYSTTSTIAVFTVLAGEEDLDGRVSSDLSPPILDTPFLFLVLLGMVLTLFYLLGDCLGRCRSVAVRRTTENKEVKTVWPSVTTENNLGATRRVSLGEEGNIHKFCHIIFAKAFLHTSELRIPYERIKCMLPKDVSVAISFSTWCQ